MFAPNISTHQLADTIHHERISHAALLQQIKQDRAPDAVRVDRQAQRRMTSRRLAAAMARGASPSRSLPRSRRTSRPPRRRSSTRPAVG